MVVDSTSDITEEAQEVLDVLLVDLFTVTAYNDSDLDRVASRFPWYAEDISAAGLHVGRIG
jgi:hypothetical protein